MSWYLAKLVYRITCGDGRHGPQFDVQLRLLHAGNESDETDDATAYINFVHYKAHCIRERAGQP